MEKMLVGTSFAEYPGFSDVVASELAGVPWTDAGKNIEEPWKRPCYVAFGCMVAPYQSN